MDSEPAQDDRGNVTPSDTTNTGPLGHTQGTMAGRTVEAEEPAELQGDHLELGSECTTRELAEQTAIRVAETVLEMEDVVVEESGLNVSIKRKNTDTKAKNDKIKKLSTEEQVSPAFGPAMDAPGLQDGQAMVRSQHTTSPPRCIQVTNDPPHAHSSQDTHNAQGAQSTLMDTRNAQDAVLDTQESNSSQDMQETINDCDNCQVETQHHYSLAKIRAFLKNTKGVWSVRAEDYFPDLQLFHDSARHLMRAGSFGESSFTDQEIYRLKKMLQKVRSRLEGAD